MSNKKTDRPKKKGFKGERTASTLIIASSMIVFLTFISLDIKPGFVLIAALISSMASYELLHASGTGNKGLFIVNSAVSFFMVCAIGYDLLKTHIEIIIGAYIMLLLIACVLTHKKIKYTDAVMTAFSSLAVPCSFACFEKLNNISDIAPNHSHLEGIFLVMMVFSCSWLTDVFAFLVGRKIGKHKLCPRISPKKSVEGAVFGTVITAAINVFVLFVYSLVSPRIGNGDFLDLGAIKYLYVPLASIALSIIGMFGDLSASVYKRNMGIKDFSSLLPGHGGIMDRFDSTLFVLPALYALMVLVS